MTTLSRLMRLRDAPTEVNPTESQHEGWKRKKQRRNRQIKKQK